MIVKIAVMDPMPTDSATMARIAGVFAVFQDFKACAR
jgi:hypothetical protein